MYKEGQKVWSDVLSSFKTSLSNSTYKTWFSGSYVMEAKTVGDKTILVVGVKNAFLKEQIEKRYREQIISILSKNGRDGVDVVFVVFQKPHKVDLDQAPLFSGVAQELILNRKWENLSSGNTLESFVVGNSNNIAFMVATQVAANLGQLFNPFLVFGPTGVGKTHLLQAIGNEVLTKTIDGKALYVTSEKFTNDYIESLRDKTQTAFRNKYRHIDLLMIDDIQFLAGKEGTQDEFFHTFNELLLSGKQIVIASDKHPKELAKIKDRLVSRLLGGMMVGIGLPDLETKMAIIKSKCAKRDIVLTNEVVSYIAENTSGGVRELEGVLTSVLAQIKLTGKDFNLANVNLKPLTASQRPAPSKISQSVCKHFKVNYLDLKSPTRRAGIVNVRQILMYFLKHDAGLSLVQIGSLLGGRDHSTVIHGISKIENKYSLDSAFRDEVLRIKNLFN